MKNILKIFLSLTLLFTLTQCIDKDVIQYPYEEGYVTEFEVEGQKSALINKASRTIIVELNEEQDPRKVNIIKFGLVDNATTTLNTNVPLNLSKTVEFDVFVYRDWDWKIVTTQSIERYMDVKGQFGAAKIDVEARTVELEISATEGLWNVEINRAKLAPKFAKYSPILVGAIDLTTPLTINVEYWGDVKESWTISAISSERSIVTGDPAHVWGEFAIITGSVVEGTPYTPEFHYKEIGSGSTWIEVPATVKGGEISLILENLKGATTYLYRAVLLNEFGEEKEFTTESTPIIPNMGFENWCEALYKDDPDKPYWMPNIDAESEFWTSGNEGVVIAGLKSNTTPEEGANAYLGKTAKLETAKITNVVAAMFAPLAAGNLFTGYFKTQMTKPLLSANFSRPYSGRPTTLNFWYNYSPVPIDVFGTSANVARNKELYEGLTDICHVYIYIGDWTAEFVNSVDLKKELTDGVIAYGEYSSDITTGGFINKTIELEYYKPYDPNRIPTKIVLVATSSIYGENYVGGAGSTLYIDEFKFGFGFTEKLGLRW